MEPQQNELESVISPLKIVTPLSKYLALSLFIILPFLGGYVGYSLAPEKVVEVERVVEIERDVIKEAEQTINPVSDWIRYTDSESGITFIHPKNWECNTRTTHSSHPDWLQTLCLDTQRKVTNPVLALNTPYRIDFGESEGFKIIESTRTTLGEKILIKKHIQDLTSGEYQLLTYTYGESEAQNSFSASFPFRTDEGTALNEIQEISTKVVESIQY